MIHIHDLEFRYREGTFRLCVPQLHIASGSTTAIIGPSGTGKTTLLNLIAGVAQTTKGRIETHGVEVSGLDETARRDFRIRHIGLVFQEFELLDYLNVLDNILLPYRINAALELTSGVRERAAELARDVGIADQLHRNVNRLSQGERQRVAICRSLLPEPVLLLCDEPTGNLDPENTGRVLDSLFNYVKTNGTTLVSVTHEHNVLERFERIIDVNELQDFSPEP